MPGPDATTVRAGCLRRYDSAMQSTMQNSPLTVTEILRYAVDVHGDRTVSTATGDGFRHATYQIGRAHV